MMPLIQMHSFKPGGTGKWVGKYFKWVDDPTEDADLVGFVESYWADNNQYVDDVSVDRSGTTPELRCQRYEVSYDPSNPGRLPTGDWHSEPLTVGDHLVAEDWRGRPFSPGGSRGWPGAVDVTGWWECDEYGRPFDLNDLEATP
jgi:hypothetical protein